jgi:NTP pyrophosphatase (non-canonical NTP hydrolase)
MEFKELQKALIDSWDRYQDKHHITDPAEEHFVMKIGEEYGEFVQAYLVHKKFCKESKRLPAEKSKQRVAEELSDVIGAALITAHILKIDIEQVLRRVWIDV